jgi:hypothetical protein
VTIAVIDTGVDADSPEFSGRISPLSKDMLGAGRDISGSDDHGTQVALVAAGGRNNSGILGIAYDATILALRTDEVGSCGSASSQNGDSDCSFSDSRIAQAVDYASSNGAKVINISLGGSGTGTGLRLAVANAANHGSLIVVSAGNDGEAQPAAFATQLDTAAGGGLLIVGSIDEDGNMSEFSNRAGTQNGHFLVALGSRICCSYEDGKLYVDANGNSYVLSGTSFAAPQVSGAAALLAQAFPNLSGRQIADILLRSALDVGQPGPDPIYGKGILDIARAFQPIGTTSIAGGGQSNALSAVTATASPAMGDALRTASLPAVVLDEYGRAFVTDLADTVRTPLPEERLRRAVNVQSSSVSFNSGNARASFSVAGRVNETIRPDQHPFFRSQTKNRQPVQSGQLIAELGRGTAVALGYARSAYSLSRGLEASEIGPFVVAPDAFQDGGTGGGEKLSVVLRKQLGEWGVSVTAGKGAVTNHVSGRANELMGSHNQESFWHGGLSLDRRIDDLRLSGGLSWQAEKNSIIGARFHNAFGLTGADTLLLDLEATWRSGVWNVAGALRRAHTSTRRGGLGVSGSGAESVAWSLDLFRDQVFTSRDRLGIRLSQPLRVLRGRMGLRLASDYNYETMDVVDQVRWIDLAPQGSELLSEVSWRHTEVPGADISASLYHRRDPGHHMALPNEVGALMAVLKQF